MKKLHLLTAGFLLIGLLLSGCNKAESDQHDGPQTDQHDTTPYTIEEIKARVNQNPKKAVTMIINNMDLLNSVHIDRTYDNVAEDGTGFKEAVDIMKENDVLIALETVSESYMVDAECDASDLPDFGVRKGWDWREYCSSLYGADFRAEPELLTKNNYYFYDKDGTIYDSDDGKTFERFRNDNTTTFAYWLDIDPENLGKLQVSDNDDGGITVQIDKREQTEKATTLVLNKDGYVVTLIKTADENSYEFHDASKETSAFTKFNETSFDHSGFQFTKTER